MWLARDGKTFLGQDGRGPRVGARRSPHYAFPGPSTGSAQCRARSSGSAPTGERSRPSNAAPGWSRHTLGPAGGTPAGLMGLSPVCPRSGGVTRRGPPCGAQWVAPTGPLSMHKRILWTSSLRRRGPPAGRSSRVVLPTWYLLSMAIENCTLLATENCTDRGSPREGSGATATGAPATGPGPLMPPSFPLRIPVR